MKMIGRVARAHTERLASWVNAINSKFYSLGWDKKRWYLEEMADGSPIPAMSGYGDAKTGRITHSLPILDSFVWGRLERPYGLGVEALRHEAHLAGDLSGAEVREQLLAAHDSLFKKIVHSLKEEGQTYDAQRFEELIPELKRKLKWKKDK
jgi:hypothetical protein